MEWLNTTTYSTSEVVRLGRSRGVPRSALVPDASARSPKLEDRWEKVLMRKGRTLVPTDVGQWVGSRSHSSDGVGSC